MSCGGKYGTARSKIQFVIKTVMTNTVAYTRVVRTDESCYKPIKAPRSYTMGFLERGCGREADKARGVAECLIRLRDHIQDIP